MSSLLHWLVPGQTTTELDGLEQKREAKWLMGLAG